MFSPIIIKKYYLNIFALSTAKGLGGREMAERDFSYFVFN